MKVIQLAIPFFFALIAIELLASWLTRRRVFRLSDSIADLSCGVLSQITGLFVKLGTLVAYAWVQLNWSAQHWGLGIPYWPMGNPFPASEAALLGFGISWPDLLSWTVVFVLVDFLYYWNHRYGHEVNILWAGHVVHHSSEDYNLAVALRQSSFHSFFSWVFYMPLALMGVPWEMFLVTNGLNLIYQFWIHTRLIGRMGPLEWVMNTPSHHRVHHGVNPEYIDKNYAGVFIIWDRMFGTFEPEREEPVYGITTPLRTWDPIWANLHVVTALIKDARQTHNWRDKVWVFFARPGWRPADVGPTEYPKPVDKRTYRLFDVAVPAGVAAYALVHFALTIVITLPLLTAAGKLMWDSPASLWQLALGGSAWVVFSLFVIARLLELQPYAWVMENLRLMAAAAAAGTLYFLDGGQWYYAAGAVAAAVSIAWLGSMRNTFTGRQSSFPAVPVVE